VRALAIALALLIPVSLSAQTTECEVDCSTTQGAPFVVFTEADQIVTSYVVEVNGTAGTLPYLLRDGFIEFSFSSGLARGTYTFVIVAYDGDGEAWRSEPNTLTVKPGQRKSRFRAQRVGASFTPI
jgi:hypothetical protein